LGKSIYIIAFPQKETISLSDNVLSFSNPKHLFVGLLDTPRHYSQFVSIAQTDIVDTKAYPSINGKTLQVQYVIQTSNNTKPLIALYPHQSENLSGTIAVLGVYPTIRGNLRLVQTNQFTTDYPLIQPKSTFDALANDHADLRGQIHSDIQIFLQEGTPSSHDYYLGTWFGKAGTLLQLADSQGLEEDKKQLLAYIEPIFINSLSYFSY